MDLSTTRPANDCSGPLQGCSRMFADDMNDEAADSMGSSSLVAQKQIEICSTGPIRVVVAKAGIISHTLLRHEIVAALHHCAVMLAANGFQGARASAAAEVLILGRHV